MAKRRTNPNPTLNWDLWDKDYTFEHKDANLEMLQAADPYWIDLFESQEYDRQQAILRGEISLLELEEQRQRLSDSDFVPNTDEPEPSLAETPIPGETPEEAALRLESEPIDSRFDALVAHYTGQRGVLGANADFQNLDALRDLETAEARAKKKADLEAKLKSPEVNADISGARRMGILAELGRVAEAEYVFSTPGEFDRRLQAAGSERILGSQKTRAADAYYERTGNIGTRTIGDVISQPESALPIVGGVAGTIVGTPALGGALALAGATPMAKMAYDAAYTEARLAGIDKKDAENFAGAMMGSEFILESLEGKGASAVTGLFKAPLKRWLLERAGKTGTKVAMGTVAGGLVSYASEFGTSVIQDLGALGAADLVEDPTFREFLRTRIARDKTGQIDAQAVLSEWNRSGLAGAGQGGPITGAGAGIENIVENAAKTQEAILNNTIHNEEARTRFQGAVDRANDLTNTMAREAGIEGVIKTHNELLGEPSEQRPGVEPYLGTNPLEAINTQYQGAGGRLSTGVGMDAPSVPLTAQQRGERMRQSIEKGPGPAIAQEAPLGPSTALSDRPATPVAKPTPVASTAPTAPSSPTPKTKGPKKRKKVKTPNQEALLAKIEGLPSIRKKPRGRAATAKDVIGWLVRHGSADTDAAADLVNKGKLGIVDTEADLPDGVVMGRDGWYDPKAKRVYLVADRVDPKTIRGTALHEVNHFLNRNKKDPTTKTGINTLISDNLDSFNTRITRLAESGNKLAKTALERAKADGNVKEELTSYFASEALDAIGKQGALGQAAQIFRDIKSAINTTARNKGIADLSDNDISYILRRQIEDADSVDFTDDGKGLEGGAASIIGERSPDFQDTINKFPERQYRGALDNRARIEISDKEAELVRLTPEHTKFLEENGLSIRNILKHNALFKAYPDKMTTRAKVPTKAGTEMDWEFEFGPLGHINVKVDKNLSDGASYDIRSDSIAIAPKSLTSPNLKGFLLHELQHAIQARENFANGANLLLIYNRLLKEAKQQTGAPVEFGSPEEYAIRQEAWAQYDATYGEAEARLSENNFALTDAELSENLPETRMSVRAMQGDGNLKTSKAQATKLRPGSRPLMKVELPQGLASIKPTKGGEFDPMFVTSLFNDFTTTIANNPTRRAPFERMLKNYLSRWAGTGDDPLKGVVSPLLGGYSWEEAWDLALQPAFKTEINQAHEQFEINNARVYGNAPRGQVRVPPTHYLGPKVPYDTPIYGGASTIGLQLEDSDNESVDATLKLGDFLSHVAERLATVSEEELAKTDLIRAVRDTVAADEAAKKKAEKQKAIQDSKLRTYIQFPDGYRWVRLDSPGQFAAESDMMGHSVRGYEPWADGKPFEIPAHPDWVEGAVGGHPNYGYGGWEAIKADNARIYSLRDPKGKSVVTVELGAVEDRPQDPLEQVPYPSPRKSGGPFEVSQIKGAYNNAPNESLHPKIQDLLLNLNDEGLIDTALDIGDAVAGAGLVYDSVFGGESYHAATSETGQLINDYFADPDRTISSTMMRAFEKTSTDTAFFSQPPTTKRTPPQGLASTSKYSKKDVSVWDDTAGSIIKMLFLPNKGIGEEAFNTREYWRLKSAGLRDKAEGIAVRIDLSLKKDGKDAKEFEEATLKAESQKTPIERERALDALVRNYGDAGKEYRQGRMLIDQLSKEIVKDWYNEIKKTGRKASKAELRTMNTILEKLGQYTHRVYLSDLPSTGKSYAKSIMSIYDKGDASNPYFQKVQNAVDYLLEHEVGIAPREELLKKKIDTVRRTYQTWIGKGENLTKFEMIDALDAKRAEVGQKEMDAMVRKVVREMLGLDDPTSTNPISRFYRAGALDEGILQHRERVPKVLRELLGEVTNPGQRILTTISAQADLLYKNRMLSDYYDNWEGKLWVKPGDRIKPGNEKFTERLQGGLYGPLEDMYVTKNFAFAIRSQRTQIMELKDALIMAGLDGTIPGGWVGANVVQGIGKLSTVQKLTKTAFDIGAWSLNGAGSWISLLKNGQIIGATKESRDALRDAVILAMQGFGIEHKQNKETNDRLSVLLEHGIPDSVFTAELRDAEKEFFGRLLEELNKESLTNPRKAWAIAKKGVRGVRDTYGLLDSWVKIADFYGQQKYYTEYHKANGDNLTEEQINRKAADTVKLRNITYSRAPIAVQTLERGGATVFATFASEVVRVTITTPMTIRDALKMAEDAKTPEAKKIALMEATKVGVGYTTAMALLPGFLHIVLNQLWNGEDDEEKAKAEREAFLKLWFETDRDQSYVVLGKNADGGIVLFNAARIDPNGHTTDFVRAAAQNDDPQEYWESVKSLFTNAAGNGYVDDVWNMVQGKGAKDSMLADTFPRGQKELQDIFEWAGSSRDAADRVTRVIDNFVPTTALRLFPGYTEEEGVTIGPQNRKYVVTEAASQQDLAIAQVLAASGMRLTVIDPVKVAGFEVNTFNVERARNVTAWNRLMEREGITPDDVARTGLNIYTSEIETARRMAEVYSGLDTELAGVNPRKVLKDANLNAEDINDAALARYRSEILSPSRLRESEKRQLSKVKDPETRRIIRENYRLARATLAELQLETR